MAMTLGKAIAIAAAAHADEIDRKSGEAYMLHVMRVVMAVRGERERVVAALHDVVEHVEGWNFERLAAEGCDAETVAAVDALTRRDGEAYLDFARRAAANELARPVKVADLRDNLAAVLAHEPEATREKKARKYREALSLIGAAEE